MTGSHATNYPATDKGWTLGGAGYAAEPEVMAAHIQALYQELNGFAHQVVTKLYESHRPGLIQLEKGAKPGTPLFDWLHMVRHCITAWVVSTCARPRDRFGYILKDMPTKGEIVADAFYSHMEAVDDTEEYEILMRVVRAFEDKEFALGDLAHRAGPERRVRQDISELKTVVQTSSSEVAARSSSAVADAASTVANAIVDAASASSHVQRCGPCRAKPFVLQLQHACRRPQEADPIGWSAADKLHGCVCHFIASDNSRCREMADALRACDGKRFLRLYHEWDGADEHAECVDQLGTAWLHLAVERGMLEVVDFLLSRSTSMLEVIDMRTGKPLAYAFEMINHSLGCSTMDMITKLLDYGANSTAHCTKSAHHGAGRTPEYLARNRCRLDADPEQVVALLRSYRRERAPAREGLPPRATSSSLWLPLSQRLPTVSTCCTAVSSVPTSSNAFAISSPPVAADCTALTTVPPSVHGGEDDQHFEMHGRGTAMSPATWIVAANPATEATLQQQLALAHAKIEALSGPKAKVPQGMPLELKQLTDVPHMMRVWRTIIAAQERLGTAWRSEQAVGKQTAKWAKQLLSQKYFPVANAVMKRHVDDGMPLDAAIDAVQKLKSHGDWKFISDLPVPDGDAKKRYRAALLELTPLSEASSSSTPPRTSPQPSQPAPDSSSTLQTVACEPSVPVVEGATRYLAFDPSLSCGWAVLQVAAGEIVSVAVGVIQVEGTDVGTRCNDLKRQIQSLLTPPPAEVLVESFHGHSRASDAISFQLRAVIAMEAGSREIPLKELAPQTWKNAIGVSGGETCKATIKSKIEATLGASFPSKLPNPRSGRTVAFRDDASDALGIALAGAQQRHTLWHTSIEILAPAIAGEKRTASKGGTGVGKKAKH